MASTCDDCGYRNSEVCFHWLYLINDIRCACLVLRLLTCLSIYCEQLKPGGAIPKKGKKIILSVRNIADLSRDVIKVSFSHSLWINGGQGEISPSVHS